MPFVARHLDEPPMVRHCLRPVLHVHAFEVGVDEFALVELGLDAVPIRVDALVRAGDRVEADDFPCFGEALVLLGRPLDARLAGPGRPLLLLLPFPCRSRRLLLLLLLLLWLLLAVVELAVHVAVEVDCVVLGSEPGGGDGDGRAGRDDVLHVGLCHVGVAEMQRGGL
ncbi:hypothetical protein ACQJBY_062257 [Aegilops geniculata]